MKENVFSKLGVNVHIGLDMEGQNANKIANVEALSPTEVKNYNCLRIYFNN